jgi:hypothetical protein
MATSSSDLRAPSVPTKRAHAHTAKLGSAAQVAYALNDPTICTDSKRSTHTYLASFVRPDAGKPKDRRGSTGLFMRRRGENRGFPFLVRDRGVLEEEEEARMDVEDAVWAWACEDENGGYGVDVEEMAGLTEERREGGYGGLVERAVSSNRERLRKRLEGDGWEFVGGRYGDGDWEEAQSEGSEVDEEFDGVVVCAA